MRSHTPGAGRLIVVVAALCLGATGCAPIVAGAIVASSGGGGGGGAGPPSGPPPTPDAPSVAFTSAQTVLGGEAGTGTVTVRLTLPGSLPALTSAVTVRLAAQGSAGLGSDLTTSTTSVTFPAGSTSGATQAVVVSGRDDALVEGTERLELTLTASRASIGARAKHEVVVPDDERATISFASAASVAAEGAGDHAVTVTLSITPTLATLAVPLTLDVARLASSTATSPADLGSASSTVTFASGAGDGVAAVVTLALVDDLLVEGTEVVALALQSVSAPGSLGGVRAHDVTITDSDAAFVSFARAVSNPTEGDGALGVLLKLTTVPAGATLADGLTVDVVQSGGTATPASDFVGTPATVSFPAGRGNGEIRIATITISNDVVDEDPNETIGLALQGISPNASITPGGHVVTIDDDDRFPGLIFSKGRALSAATGGEVRFTVTVNDPQADPCSLRLLHVPPGCVMSPVTSAAVPFTRELAWRVQRQSLGLQRLIFETSDGLTTTRRAVEVQVTPGISFGLNKLVVGDVTGDGVLDVVATSRFAGGVFNTGVAYLWAGATVPSGAPTATLTHSTARGLGNELGALQLADVTGDGTLDVVAATPFSVAPSAGGLILIWAGGSGLVGAPAATALLRSGGAGDELIRLQHADRGLGLQLADLTGDGTLDVLAASNSATVNGAVNAGALFLWTGGAGLVGTPPPTAILRVPNAAADDRLCDAPGAGVYLIDVTGDGTLDAVTAGKRVDVGSVVDGGAVYVWEGGANLSGAVDPTATLTRSSPIAFDNLGSGSGQVLRFADVTGDGLVDVVVVGSHLVVNGLGQVGGVLVWAGGAGLRGTPAPLAALSVPGAKTFDRLGEVGTVNGPGVQLSDVTGDDVADVVCGASFAEVNGVQVAGAVFVWAGGGTLVAATAPTASLMVTNATPGRVGQASGETIQLFDVTGDGTRDVIVTTDHANTFANDDGAVYVWAGGSNLTGARTPTATLSNPGTQERLGSIQKGSLGEYLGQGVLVSDVTGDGTLDLVVGSENTAGDGAVYLWAGGVGIAGAPPPTATMAVPGALDFDALCNTGLMLADVVGDAALDVIAATRSAGMNGSGGIANAGAVYVWTGGAGLVGASAPVATLKAADARGLSNLGVQVGDVTNDGRLDIVTGSLGATVNGVAFVGALYVWAGGAGLTGELAASATLTVQGAAANDFLGDMGGDGFMLADVTGDGILDLVTAAASADVNGVQDAGAIYVRVGGSTLAGAVNPTSRLAVPGAEAGDKLTGN